MTTRNGPAHSAGGAKVQKGLPQFLHTTGLDGDGEPMTTTICGVESLLGREYGDLRAVFTAHLPQSIKSKSTSASPAEVDNQEVLLKHDQSVAKLTAFRVSA